MIQNSGKRREGRMKSRRQGKFEADNDKFARVSPDGDDVYGITKQMGRTIYNALGENQLCNGGLELADEDHMKAWVERHARLLNVEFEWPGNKLPKVSLIAGLLTV